MKKASGYLGAGLLTAIAASLCCVAPLLAVFAGTGSLVSSVEWMEPFRPWLMGLSMIALGVAWYNTLRPKKGLACDCPTDQARSSAMSLLLMTTASLLTIGMLTFPLFGYHFYPSNPMENTRIPGQHTEKMDLRISGMTCQTCEAHIVQAVHSLPGVVHCVASYSEESAAIEFYPDFISPKAIEQAILSTGYGIKK